MIFAFMAVPRIYQHRVLFWGILGALVMRGVMIAVGAELIARYHWILYVFGVFLLVTAVKMLVIREHSDPAQSIAVRWAKRWLPVTDQFHGEHFIVRAGSARSRKAAAPGLAPLSDAAVDRAVPGTLMLTPLALALILVETTDLIFAVASPPFSAAQRVLSRHTLASVQCARQCAQTRSEDHQSAANANQATNEKRA